MLQHSNETDSLQTEQSFRLTEFAVEVAAQAMFTIAPSGRILQANQTACERLEYSRDELVGMYVSDIDPHYPLESWPEHFDELRKRRRSIFATQHQTRSGRILDVEVSVAYFEFDGKEYCCSSVRDITEQKQAESLSRLQHDVLASVASGETQHKCLTLLCELVEDMVPHSLASVMLLDESDGCLRFEAGPRLTDKIKAAFEPLAPGFESGSCGAAAHLNQPVIVQDTRTSPHWKKLQHIVEEFKLLACWSLPISNDEGQTLGTFAISHSQSVAPSCFQLELLETACHLASIPIRRRIAQEELRRRHDELAHVSRLSTMGEMASNTAHELNQPLAAIVNYACALEQVIQNGQLDLTQASEITRRLAEQALRAGDIMRSVRQLATKAEAKRVPTDVNSVIRRSLVLLEPETRHNSIELCTNLTDSLPTAPLDSIQIQQVLVNLVRNAIDAVQHSEREERLICISSSLTGSSEIRICVNDSGPGIEQDRFDSIFEAYESTKPDGMGMGLAISRSIAESHSGRLTVESTGGCGSTFCLALPVNQGEHN